MRSSLINLLLMCLAVGATFSIVEIVLGWKYPYIAQERTWPSQFNPRVGWTFVPGQILKWTDHFEFSSSQTINSLGFPDREPSISFADNEFRVLILGDSFVEAAQVDIPHKMPALLEQRLQAKLPHRVVKTVALGYSGAGTSNVLPFYSEIGRPLKPHLVVLVFVSNDMSNNSPVLEAIRNGWHPYHPPRLFFEREEAGGFRRIDIDSSWSEALLPVSEYTRVEKTEGLAGLLASSNFYRFFKYRYERAVRYGDASDLYRRRADYLRQMPGFEEKLKGWAYPQDLFMDDMFFLEKADMPRGFSEALEITGHAVAELKKEVQRDGAKLVIMANEGCSKEVFDESWGRKIIRRGLFMNLRSVVGLDVPVIEFSEYLKAHGIAEKAVHFRWDMHWNQDGHRHAADFLSEFILSGSLEQESRPIREPVAEGETVADRRVLNQISSN